MGVPILIFVLAFGLGSALSAQWLPDLGKGRVGGVAFLVVCGLLGMVTALVALHVYEIVRELDRASSAGMSSEKPDVIAAGLEAMLRDLGPILGLSLVVYLLAPAPEADHPRTGSSPPPTSYSPELPTDRR